jgi:hypothetical protein
MSQVLSKWRFIAVIVSAMKVLAIISVPPTGELLRWSIGAGQALDSLAAGRLPPVSPYGMMFAVLSPFFWMWKILPVAHPTLQVMECYTLPRCGSQTPLSALVSLAAVMKSEIFIFDILTGVLVYRIVQQITNSQSKSSLGFLAWYVNPFNFGWLYLYGYLGDVIPAAIVVLAVTLANDGKWFRCSAWTVLGTLLRIYPALTLPFLWPKMRTNRGRAVFETLGGFLFLSVPWLIAEYATSGATLATIAAIPTKSNYLLDVFAPNIPSGALVRWTPVLMITQLYVMLRFWKADVHAVHLTTVAILALLLGAGPIFQQNQFLWLSPLLSICLALHPEELWIFILTFSTDVTCDYCTFLSGYTPLGNLIPHGVWGWLPNLTIAGAFYAFKAAYLVKLNLENIAT